MAKSLLIAEKTKAYLYRIIYIDTGCEQEGVLDGASESFSPQKRRGRSVAKNGNYLKFEKNELGE